MSGAADTCVQTTVQWRRAIASLHSVSIGLGCKANKNTSLYPNTRNTLATEKVPWSQDVTPRPASNEATFAASTLGVHTCKRLQACTKHAQHVPPDAGHPAARCRRPARRCFGRRRRRPPAQRAKRMPQQTTRNKPAILTWNDAPLIVHCDSRRVLSTAGTSEVTRFSRHTWCLPQACMQMHGVCAPLSSKRAWSTITCSMLEFDDCRHNVKNVTCELHSCMSGCWSNQAIHITARAC
jgi:hypothetical protein